MATVSGREVLHGDVVGDDEAVQMLAHFPGGLRFGVQQKMIGPAEYIDVGQHAALRREEERIATLARLQLLNMIGGHGVQQARAILARQPQAASRRHIPPCRALAQRLITGHGSFTTGFVERYRSQPEINTMATPEMMMPVARRLRFASSPPVIADSSAAASTCRTSRSLMPIHM
jgi:hypothetical protein